MARSGKPFRFLDYYDIEDSDIFFGRDKETRILLADILVSRLVVLFAPTGTGKSSLINAGVRSRLEKQDYATFLVRVHRDPAESMREELLSDSRLKTPKGDCLSEELEHVATQLGRPIVIFFDQFEEFFIYILKADPAKARDFIANIGRLYHNDSSRVHVVFSMREEFFVEMDAFREEIPTVFHNECNLRLRGLEKEQAREAIAYPLRAFETWIEAELVDKIIADLSQTSAIGYGQIESAQLQIVCDTLWARRKDNTIRLKDYLELGGGEQNIARRLLVDRFLDTFSEIGSPSQLDLLERLLPLLRTTEGTKYVRQIQDLAQALKTEEGPLRQLLEKLERSGFIRRYYRPGLQVIELAHDYLVEHLEGFRSGVRTILPRRALSAAMQRSAASNDGATKEELETIAPALKEMDIQRREAEVLFRSTLALDRPLRVFFIVALELEVPIWDILRDRIFTGAPNQAARAFRSIGDLALPGGGDGPPVELPEAAFDLLDEALRVDDERTHAAEVLLAELATTQTSIATNDRSRRMLLDFLATTTRPIASEAVAALGSIETDQAVLLLEKALPREAAQDALVRLVTAKNGDIAQLARTLAVKFVRDALTAGAAPSSAIRALGEIETQESLGLLRQAIRHPELVRTARFILEQRFLNSKDKQIAAEARQALVEQFSTEKASSLAGDFQLQSQRRQNASSEPEELSEWDRMRWVEIVEAVREGSVLFIGPGVHYPPPDSSGVYYPESDRPLVGSQLARLLSEESGFLSELPNEDIHNLRRVAEWYEVKFDRHYLVNRIRSTLSGARPSPVLRALAALPFTHIVTVCFDRLLEDALYAAGKKPTLNIYDRSMEYDSRIDIDASPAQPLLVKLYGDIETPNSVVITDEDVLEQSMQLSSTPSRLVVPEEIRYRLHRWPSLFVGWSFRDYHLRFIWRVLTSRVESALRPHAYAIDPYPDRLWTENVQRKRSLMIIKQDTWTFVAALTRAITGKDSPL